MGKKKLGTKGKKERGHTQEKRKKRRETKERLERRKRLRFFGFGGREEGTQWGFCDFCRNKKSRAFFLHSWKPHLCCCCCCCNSNIIFSFPVLAAKQSSHFCKITLWQALFFFLFADLATRSSHWRTE